MPKPIYMFDLDGTIAGSTVWYGLFTNTMLLFKSRHIYTFPEEWGIITARPKIDLPIIKMVCRYHNLYPMEIITSPTWFYKYKSDDKSDIGNFKSEILCGIATENKNSKVVYIDTDTRLLSMIKLCSHNIILTTSYSPGENYER